MYNLVATVLEIKDELGFAQQLTKSHLELWEKTFWGLPEISVRDFAGSREIFESLE